MDLTPFPPGLDPELTTHKLNVLPSAYPVRQATRFFRPELEVKIKEEVKKLLEVDFIAPIQHPIWLSNIVPVEKKNSQIRVCVDFRDLNRACPKDPFPLPNIETLVDAGDFDLHGWVGYQQIKMDSSDAIKTAFRTPFGNFAFWPKDKECWLYLSKNYSCYFS